MARWLLLAALAACLALGVAARPVDSQVAVGSPAFAANLHQSGVQKLVDIVLPMLVAKIRGIHIPDVSGKQSSFNYDITSIIIQQVSYGAAPVSLQTNVNFALQNLYVHVTLNWKYKESIWPHVPFGSGSADVTISESGGQVAISAAEVGGKPVLHVDSVAVSLNKLDIKIHGSIFSWLYDIIINLFKGTIKSAIQNAVRDQLSSLIQNQVNAMIAAFSFHIQITDRMLMNWELTSAPTFPGDGSMLVYLNGGFEQTKPDKVAPLPHSALKTDRSGRMIDIAIDQFLPDSAFWAMWDLGYLMKFVRPQDIDPSSPVQLNTASFKLVFPALYNAFPNRNMQLLFYSTAPPAITLTPPPGETAVDALTNVIVFADSNGAGAYVQAFTLSSLLHLDMQANITGERLTMNFPDIHFILGLVNSTIGTFDVTIMDVLIDIALNKVLLPGINEIANKGVPLPSISGLSFVNAFITFASGYMNVGTDLNYRPPGLTLPPPTEWELTRSQFPTANAINLNDEL